MPNSRRILVVDDQFEILEMMQSMLTLADERYVVMTVPSAEEGMLELTRTPFDLIISDVRLPGMSGFDLVSRIHRIQPGVPILIMTGYSSAEKQQEAAALGVTHFFPKPLDAPRLLQTVQTILLKEPQAKPADRVRETAVADAAPVPTPTPTLPSLTQTLTTFHKTAAAIAVLLATNNGEIVATSTDVQRRSWLHLVVHLAAGFGANVMLGSVLGGEKVQSGQYLVGKHLTVQSVDVDDGHFLVGIWATSVTAVSQKQNLDPSQMRGFAQKLRVRLPKWLAIQEPAPPTILKDKEPDPAPAAETKPMSSAEITALESLLNQTSSPDADLENYWEEALSGEEASQAIRGLTFEEAQKQGLLSNLDKR